MKNFSVRAFIPPPVLRKRCLLDQRRFYAVQAAGTPAVEVFNNRSKWLQKERAAADVEGSRKVDYLRDEVASRLSERLLVCTPRPTSLPQLLNQHLRILAVTSPKFSTLEQTLATSHAYSHNPT
jgi:hypothetical protein